VTYPVFVVYPGNYIFVKYTSAKFHVYWA